MKVKFLVPEIDRDRWSEKLKHQMKIRELKSKDLSEMGAEVNSEQRIQKYKNGSIPNIDTFLSLCRFFVVPPDSFLFAKPEWIECEIDKRIEDFPLDRVLGMYQDTYYIIPSYKTFRKNRCYNILRNKKLFEEPDNSDFLNFHLYGTEYDLCEEVEEGKIIYRLPYVNGEKTSSKIFSLLDEYKLPDKQLTLLLGLRNQQSITNRRNGKNEWTISDIYKLSWILSIPFENLLEIDYHKETCLSLFDPITFLEHYKAQ